MPDGSVSNQEYDGCPRLHPHYAVFKEQPNSSTHPKLQVNGAAINIS